MKVRVPNIDESGRDELTYSLADYPVLEGNGPIAVDVHGNIGVVVDGELVGYVEEGDGGWWADTSFGHAPNAGPFPSREEAMKEFTKGPIDIFHGVDDLLFGQRDEQARVRWEKNGNRSDGKEACVLCGKLVGRFAYMVRIAGGGMGLVAIEDIPRYQELRDGGDMGTWRVGSSCASKVPAKYLAEPSNI